MLYAIALVAGVELLGLQAAFATRSAFVGGIVMGIPGMILQILVLPVLYKRLLMGNIGYEVTLDGK